MTGVAAGAKNSGKDRLILGEIGSEQGSEGPVSSIVSKEESCPLVASVFVHKYVLIH
jgi:hypothetical protein